MIVILSVYAYSLLSDSGSPIVTEEPAVTEGSAFTGDPAVTEANHGQDAAERLGVLVEEADKQNIKVTDNETEQFIQASLTAYNMSREELAGYLQQAGITYDQYTESVKSQLKVAQLVQENVDVGSLDVSEKEVDAFIDANRNDFEEFFNDDNAMLGLRSKVRSMLLQEKQAKLVMDYVQKIELKNG